MISAESIASEDRPILSRDGLYLAFRTHNPVTGGRTLSAVLKGREVSESLCSDCGVSIPWGWSPDGNQLLYQHDQYALHLRVIAPPRSIELLRDRKFNIYQASFSPDQRWLLFLTHSMGAGNPRIFAAPFKPDTRVPASDWIAITDGKAVDDKPRWALDGNGAFFRSNIDGYQCIWFQALASGTKQPVGQPVPVRHFHDPRLAPPAERNFENELAVAADKLVLSLEEPRSEIWLLKMSP